MKHRKVLWIGCRHREFLDIAHWFSQHAEVRFAADPIGTSPKTFAPTLVLVALSGPTAMGRAETYGLRDQWPNARVVYLLGEWCSGQKRATLRRWEMEAAYAHDLTNESQLRGLLMPKSPTVFPITPAAGQGTQPTGPLAVICSPSWEFRVSLAHALDLIGLKTVAIQPHDQTPITGTDFVIWDAAIEQERQVNELHRLTRRYPESRILAVVTYPRRSDVARFRALGVHLLARPFLLDDLFSFFRQSHRWNAGSAA